jgi:predicted dehydrogenase
MDTINWGILGCGDVAEVKSGPAFNKVKNSSLVAVMRRNAAKAEDYALRHKVSKWYSDASLLINDPDVNAIYVATPPSSHEGYTLAALRAGKCVYVEKPMSVSAASAAVMAKAAGEKNNKLVVAHYRRAQPLYNRIKQLIHDGAIGDVRFARIEVYKTVTAEQRVDPGWAWRLDPAVGGGGIFHDISPHQLDILYYFFGEVDTAFGISATQGKANQADDIVTGTIAFKNGVLFSGVWCFDVPPGLENDMCEIIGSEGKISFSFFEHKPVILTRHGKTETISFDPLAHVQQPMIEKVVNYFLGKGSNPCSAQEGVAVMKMIDALAEKN